MQSIALESGERQSVKPSPPSWYRPIWSPEHGVYVVLLGSFLTGAAAAQHWTFATTIALLCAFCGFLAEHPLTLQIRQRRSLKPRFILWGSLYGLVAGVSAVWLYLHHPIILWIYLGALLALVIDAISVFWREQKSITNELITFTAVCLSAPLAYAATTGTISLLAVGLWILNTLAFSSTIFTVKLRKAKTPSLIPGAVYHGLATLIIIGIYYFGWLPLVTALAFVVVLLKFSLIASQQTWYCQAPIQFVAMWETISACLFVAIAALSVLPAHLPS